jgi:uncharacterized protein with HEPN domain
MSDPELAQDILANIMTAITRIERRFEGIDSPDDFVMDDFGIDRLDGITMMLIAMGEQLKRLDSALDFDLENDYPEIDWKGAKRTRDFLSHHYFTIDAEIIFDICQNKLADLKQAIISIQNRLS